MWKTTAATAVSLFILTPAVPAHADPEYADAAGNFSVFLQSIEQDGIDMDDQQAIREGLEICRLMRPPGDASLWDAGQHVLANHPDWRVSSALKFANRSVQNICPNRGSF